MKRQRVVLLIVGLIPVLSCSALHAANITAWCRNNPACIGRVDIINAWQRSGPASRQYLLAKNNQWYEDTLTWGLPTSTDGTNPSAADLSFQWFVLQFKTREGKTAYALKNLWGDPAYYPRLRGSNYFTDGQQNYSYYLARTYDYLWNRYVPCFARLDKGQEAEWLKNGGSSFPPRLLWDLGQADKLGGIWYKSIKGAAYGAFPTGDFNGRVSIQGLRTQPIQIVDEYWGSDGYTDYHTFGLSNVDLNSVDESGTWWSARWQFWMKAPPHSAYWAEPPESVMGPFMDESASVVIHIYTKYHFGQNHTVSVNVAPDEVVIGGGAKAGPIGWEQIDAQADANAEAGYSNEGGMLTGSYPLMDGLRATGWVAESRDAWWVPSRHFLWVYAIGMKLRKNSCYVTGPEVFSDPSCYIPRDTLLQYIRYDSAVSEEAQHPVAKVSPPPGSGFTIVSGGARVLDNPWGNFLTGSYGERNSATSGYAAAYDTWVASSKDHATASPAKIIAYAISFNHDNRGSGAHSPIPDYDENMELFIYDDQIQRNWTAPEVFNPVLYTYPNVRGTAEIWNTRCLGERVVTGVGGRVEYNDWGRMLTELWYTPVADIEGPRTNMFYYFPGGYGRATVGDRDYWVGDSGKLHAQLILIRRDTEDSQGGCSDPF